MVEKDVSVEIDNKIRESLSELTGVPYSRIYKVLNEMSEKQIIQKIDSRPSRFLANDPQTVFTQIKKQMDKSFEENIGDSLPFLKGLYGDTKVKKIKMNFYEGKACLDHLQETIYNTARSLSLVLKHFDSVFPQITNNLDFMYTKGVEVKIILEEKFKNHELLRDFLQERSEQLFEVKYLPFIQEGFVISDKKEGLQALRGSFNIANPDRLTFSILSSETSTYVSYLGEMFKQIWSRAT